MASPTTSLVWADGQLFDEGELPDRIKVELGRLLGMSPAVYLRGVEQLEVQVDVLGRGAAVLGYLGFDRVQMLAELTAAVAGHSEDVLVASLLPSPASHKAAPPGENWFLNIDGFEPGAASETSGSELSLGVSPLSRNHHSPSANVLLLDDLELDLADRTGTDATLWLNSYGNVACADRSTVVIREGHAAFTPPLSDGAIESGWRRQVVASGTVVESSIPLARLLAAEGIAVLTPWGESLDVAKVVGVDGNVGWVRG
ncbi:MAG: aminotransferase class IV [Microthrixaceae bacterium]